MKTNLAAELVAEEALELAEEEIEEARLEAELVREVWALLKLEISDMREEREALLVAVARTLLRDAPREPALERAEFCADVMEEMADVALDWMLLTTEEPLARAELTPEETADAADDAELKLEVSWLIVNNRPRSLGEVILT